MDTCANIIVTTIKQLPVKTGSQLGTYSFNQCLNAKLSQTAQLETEQTGETCVLSLIRLPGSAPQAPPCPAVQSERNVRKENNNKVKELEQALDEARTELQAEKLLLQQVSHRCGLTAVQHSAAFNGRASTTLCFTPSAIIVYMATAMAPVVLVWLLLPVLRGRIFIQYQCMQPMIHSKHVC